MILAQATAQVAAHRNAPVAPSQKVQVLLEYLLMVPAADAANLIGPDVARQLALRWFPSSPRLLYRMAEQSFKFGDMTTAAGLLERLLDLGRTGNYDRSHSFDPGRIGDDARMNLAACYRRLGRIEGAQRCYRQLLDSRHFQKQAARELSALKTVQRGPVSGEPVEPG